MFQKLVSLRQLGFVKTSEFLRRTIYFLIFCHELYHFLAFRLCGYSDAEISINVDRLEGRTSISSFKLAHYKNPRNWAITFVEIPWYKDIFITLAPFLLTAPFYLVTFLVLKYVLCLTKFSFLFWYTVIVLFTFPGKALSESDVKYAFDIFLKICRFS